MTLSVFICEDDPKQREQLETIVSDYIALKGCGTLELVLSTGDPMKVLDCIEFHPHQNSLYILDIELDHEMNGVQLATKIRRRDSFGKIVFVTTHAEYSPLTFRYRVEAMDYIIKERPKDVAERVLECIDIAYERYLNSASKRECYLVKTGEGLRKVPLDEIMFFESHHISHKLILHMRNKRIGFYGSLSEVAEASPDFFRSHKAFVVNTKNIKFVNKAEQKVEMVNGEVALVTAKKVKALLEAMGQ